MQPAYRRPVVAVFPAALFVLVALTVFSACEEKKARATPPKSSPVENSENGAALPSSPTPDYTPAGRTAQTSNPDFYTPAWHTAQANSPFVSTVSTRPASVTPLVNVPTHFAIPTTDKKMEAQPATIVPEAASDAEIKKWVDAAAKRAEQWKAEPTVTGSISPVPVPAPPAAPPPPKP
jgi:hypothetical protein